ncbi:MAG TPA: hypothetical protein VNO50_10760 [Pyrinomonadaceae bacterium]|nr:hypothetical protein [Pyrinomonadaceae bacterium]
MRYLSFLILLTLLLPRLQAANLVTGYFNVTNVPAIGDQAEINGTAYTFTNDVSASPSSLILITNSVPWTATNLSIHLGSYRVSFAHIVSMSASNVVSVVGFVGEDLTLGITGNWGYVSYPPTNTVAAPTFVVTVPWTAEASTNATNIASMLVDYLGVATNAIGTNAPALAKYATLQTAQTMGNKVLTNSYFQNVAVSNGTISVTNSTLANSAHTGSTWTGGSISGAALSASNAVLHSLISTNGTNYGLSFSSPGPLPGSQQFGGGVVTGNGTNGLAVGANAVVTGRNGIAVGTFALAGASNSAAYGAFAEINDGADGATSIGTASGANAPYSLAAGALASVGSGHTNSTAIGYGTTTTAPNQVRIAMPEHTTSIAGILEAASATNNTWTGTNILRGDLSTPAFSFTTLGAGNNFAVDFGTNHYIRINGTLTGDAALCGIVARARDGLSYLVENNTGYILTLSQNTIDPTPANRFSLHNGNNISVVHGGFFALVYDAAESRWNVDSVYPQVALGTNVAVTLSGDNATVSTTNRAYVRLTSDSVTATSRTFILTPGSSTGQTLKIHFTGAFGAELVDDSAGAVSGNHRLASTWTASQYDSISLTWDGTDWIEDNRSAN